jgi:hypothetical protein
MQVRKRSLIFAALVVAAVLVMAPGVAMANYSIHGSYTMSTDACAGCHRAHTASSPITWENTLGTERSALLISTAETIDEFCYTCHGAGMLGADTNVYDGVFEANDGDDTGEDRVYNTAGEALNGGGFDPVMFPTQHYASGVDWVAYGAGPTGQDGIISTGGEQVYISCGVCHDVHGSSNYRLLKDVVAGIDPVTGAQAPITVGGYDGSIDPINPTPTPWVISSEVGYPTGGWLLHEPGAVQVAGYFPDYTTPRYAKAPDGDVTKGISAWCAACHTQYNTAGDSGVITDTDTTITDGDYLAEHYDANDGFGYVVRHRHPVNVELSTYLGARDLVLDSGLPLAHDPTEALTWAAEATDWLDCLTCHVGHGSGATMTGYAAVVDSTDPMPDSSYGLVPGDGLGSVPPDDGNALLRMDERGVCEACHNK